MTSSGGPSSSGPGNVKASGGSDPRLFVIQLKREGKAPAYVLCERTAIIEAPIDKADVMKATLFGAIEGFFRQRSAAMPPYPAVGIPAELDPSGGGYMLMASSMGHDPDPNG